MLYGTYSVYVTEKDIKKLTKELAFKNVEFDNGTFNISLIPVCIYFGNKYLPDNEY